MSETASLVAELRALVGERHVNERANELLVYETDALPGYHTRPSLAVFPGSRDEVIAVVRLLAEHGVSYVPRGAGTGLSGGALANGVVLLGLQRLKRILSLDPAVRRATVEPGVVNAWLTSAAAPHKLHYAPDPSSQTACTIGGNVAENAGGPHCLKYGATLNHIIAATVILPSGEIVALRIPQHPSEGYDLMGAFVGSEGCFGVALDITVRLTPNPEAVRTLLADYTTVEQAARTTSAIIASGIVPAACELMDHGTIQAVEASIYAAGYPADAAAVLLVEVDGSAASVGEEAERVERLCSENGARSVRIATDAVDRARLWQGRKKAFGAMGRMAPHLAVQDGVVPRTKLAEILAAIAVIGERHGIRVCNVFHAGDGNLHPNVPYDGRNLDETRRVHAAMREIMALCIASGGSITGEHGVGLDKLVHMDKLFSPDTLDAMCRLRSAFDPEKRSNPGKVVPVHSCREWHGVSKQQQQTTEHTEKTENDTDSSVSVSVSSAWSVVASGSVESRVASKINEARDAGTQIYVAGARTRVTEPPRGAIILDVREYNQVLEYIPADLTITVGAGMTLAELDAITLAHDQWCPFLPWGGDGGTVGGTLARAQRGPASAALGAPRDLTLGMTFVDGRACVVRCGGRVVKNVAGFDLTRTLIGSWGTLGIITTASLRLRARPRVRETWIVPAEAVSHAALDALTRGPYTPVACERIPARVSTALGATAEDHVVVWLAGGGAHVAAARAAFSALAPAREIPEDAWRTIRAHGPYAAPPAPAPIADSLARLTARVRDVFDPDEVFTSPMMPRRPTSHVPRHQRSPMSEPALHNSPLAREIAGLDACVHCGFCLTTCPTYIALEDENDSPRGRIVLMRGMLDGDIALDDPDATTHLDRCLGCRACETACPSGVPYGHLLEATRATIAQARPLPWKARAMLYVFARPALLQLAMAAARVLRASGIPALVSRLSSQVTFPFAMLASTSRRPRQVSRSAPPGSASRERVAVLTGCVMEGLLAPVNRATEQVLEAQGYRLIPAPEQRCCGALHAHAGDAETARTLAKANVAAFEASDAEVIAVNSAGCGAMLKDYGHILRDDPVWRDRAARVSARVRDISELLAAAGPRPTAGRSMRVAYDAPCHLLHGQRVAAAPLQVLGAVGGVTLVPLTGSDQCCGSAGIFNLIEPDVAARVLKPKIEAIAASGAEIVATGNPGCLMQIGAGLLQAGSRVVARHPVELLADGYAEERVAGSE
jgi:glycolate oxidase subunit GlcD